MNLTRSITALRGTAGVGFVGMAAGLLAPGGCWRPQVSAGGTDRRSAPEPSPIGGGTRDHPSPAVTAPRPRDGAKRHLRRGNALFALGIASLLPLATAARGELAPSAGAAFVELAQDDGTWETAPYLAGGVLSARVGDLPGRRASGSTISTLPLIVLLVIGVAWTFSPLGWALGVTGAAMTAVLAWLGRRVIDGPARQWSERHRHKHTRTMRQLRKPPTLTSKSTMPGKPVGVPVPTNQHQQEVPPP